MADNSTVIVAIPSPDDKVWKISSEKVPHMTLLYLGDQSNNPRLGHIESYLEHVVATSESRFGMSVDRRGTLGPEDADVLFFDDHGVKKMQELRSYLLKDTAIFTAYNSVQQFPEWTPHLTLGYPATPAHKDDSEYPGIHWVNFDRIALWVGDYEGPEFLLSSENFADSVMAMSDSVTEEFLAHHGIKGMKWGVRRSDAQLGHPSGGSSTKSKLRGAVTKLVGKKASHPAEVPSSTDHRVTDNSPSKHVAVDAERSAHTVAKGDTIEMSTAEMKAANDRMNTIMAYRKFFDDGGVNSELKNAVDRLSLQVQYRELQKQLNPPKRSAVDKFISGTQKGWSAYSQVDNKLNGKLTKAIAKKVGLDGPVGQAQEAVKNAKNPVVQKQIADLFPQTKVAEARAANPSRDVKLAQAYNRQAAQAVKDAQDLNKILDEVLNPTKGGALSTPVKSKPGRHKA